MAKNKKKAAKKPAVKKTASKKPAKKVTKKATPKKKATPVKKVVAKKAAPKKAAAKKSVTTKSVVSKTKAPVKNTDWSQMLSPLEDRVLVRMHEMEKMTPGGLYIPYSVSNVSGNLQGTVVAMGKGRRNKKGHTRPLDLKLGDNVLFPEYAGTKIKIQEQDLLIMREEEILGVVE